MLIPFLLHRELALIRRVSARLTLGLIAAMLGACSDRAPAPPKAAAFVSTQIVQAEAGQTSVTLTGEVQSRYRADLSFRVSGRVIERFVDVGNHVEAGQVLARLDPAEQQADVEAATAAVAAAEAQLRAAKATFERQKSLVGQGYTTRVAYDEAEEGLRTAEGALEAVKAQLGTANDALSYTQLRAGASGVITARNLEVGRVVQMAEPVYGLALDGECEAVFDVDEFFLGELAEGAIGLKLVSDARVTAYGRVREISPAVDPKTSTVRVKVTIQNPPAEMRLGTAVAGTRTSRSSARITVPWTALMASGGTPAVWTVDAATNTAALKAVTVARYEAATVVIKDGLNPGDRVVIDGGKLLSVGQPVMFAGGAS
jgi:membrane fusion protein, multidrug efflux system